MDSNLDAAAVARIIGQPARASMLDALLSGRWLTANELASRAGVAPPTASEHLRVLVQASLVKRRTSGRYRYHALAGPEVAEILEALGRLAPPDTGSPKSANERALRFARTCYDHLAGRLGVLVADALLERDFVTRDGTTLTPAGASFLERLGADPCRLEGTRRPVVRLCLDWSERRDHLAGALGATLLEVLLERRWITRMAGTRAVRVTLRGRDSLQHLLGIPIEVSAPSDAHF